MVSLDFSFSQVQKCVSFAQFLNQDVTHMGFIFSLLFKRLRVLFFAFQATSLRDSYKHTYILFWDTSICDNITLRRILSVM